MLQATNESDWKEDAVGCLAPYTDNMYRSAQRLETQSVKVAAAAWVATTRRGA